MRTILNYPGSKWNIASKLVELIPKHHSYVEPFFGSGAVLFNKPVSDIETINDLDHDVVNLFRCIQEDAEHLARMVMVTPFSREKYEDTFAKNKTVSGRYRCAYCGRKLAREKITIDHIFPVHCMEEYPAVRRRAALFGIRGSNDLKNLVPACRRCNLRKGPRMGWWIIKGFLGRTWWYWPVRKLLRLTVILAVAYLCR